jgi:hypothetical protein
MTYRPRLPTRSEEQEAVEQQQDKRERFLKRRQNESREFTERFVLLAYSL